MENTTLDLQIQALLFGVPAEQRAAVAAAPQVQEAWRNLLADTSDGEVEEWIDAFNHSVYVTHEQLFPS